MEECRLSVLPNKRPSQNASEASAAGTRDSYASPSNACADITNTINSTLQTLLEIYSTAGYSDKDICTYLLEFNTRLKEISDSEIATERRILNVGKDLVDSLESDVVSLLSSLGRRQAPLSNYKVKDNYNSRLNALQHEKQALAEEMSRRKACVNVLLRDIQALADALGEAEMHIDTSNETADVSDGLMHQLEERLRSMQALSIKRIDKGSVICSECFKLFEEMGALSDGLDTMPDSPVYADVDAKIVLFIRDNTAFPFTVHRTDLELLDSRRRGLIEEREARRREIGAVGESIASLWTSLRISKTEQAEFAQSISTTLSSRTMKRGADELQRLRMLRSQSMARFIDESRTRIVALWDEARLPIEDRRIAFPLYFSRMQDLDEAAIDQHEEYYMKMRDRVGDLRPLLLKIQAREAVVSDRIELEQIQLNPERLKNRGANVFAERKREEAMAKGVRTLDRVTSELREMLAMWENKYGAFEYAGEKYEERMQQQEQEYLNIKEKLKNSRTKRKLETPLQPDSHDKLPAHGAAGLSEVKKQVDFACSSEKHLDDKENSCET